MLNQAKSSELRVLNGKETRLQEFSFVLHILTLALNIKIKCGILISHPCAFLFTHVVLLSLEPPLV